MDEVKSLSSLRALILNGRSVVRKILCMLSVTLPYEYLHTITTDSVFASYYTTDNEISSVCKLDQMKELNTLGTCFNLRNNR